MKKFKTLVLAAACISAAMASAGSSIAAAATVEIVALGDSLTAGYGLAPGEAFPEQLEAALRERGHDVSVVNAGVSGDTASDGLARLEWSVPESADIVIVELGANDALRGVDPTITRSAIGGILTKLAARDQTAVLAGMMAPRNLGDAYAEAFDSIYPDLAAEYRVPLLPFFLEGVAMEAALNQADGMHPSAAGVARIIEEVLPQIEPLVAAAAAKG